MQSKHSEYLQRGQIYSIDPALATLPVMKPNQPAPQFADVLAAQERIRGKALETRVLSDTVLDQVVQAKAFLNCENLQRASGFKFRGAWNTMAELTPDDKSRGAIAYSSGNHAQAVALCGNLLGIKTTIVMPNDAPQTKKRRPRTMVHASFCTTPSRTEE